MAAGTTSTLNPWLWSLKTTAPVFLLLPLGLYRTFAIVFALLIFYWALGTGNLAIPPPGPRTRKKVFVIGLSRTGTTSLTKALNDLGFSTYHLCGHVVDPFPNDAAGRPAPRVVRYWADAYDGHSDITATLIYKELAEMYPDARFILTTRDPAKWGPAMKAFTVTQHDLIKHVGFPPSYRYADILYGKDWETKTGDDFSAVAAKHQSDVVDFFRRRGEESRLLSLSITGGQGWSELCTFLKVPLPQGVSKGDPFPNVDVFDLTRFLQPKWQMLNLLARIAAMFGVSVDR